MYQEKEELVLEATFNRTWRKEIEKRGMKVEQELTVDIQGNENGGGTETDRRFPVIHAKARGLRPIARGAARVYTYVWILGESSNGRLSLGVGRRERGRWNFRFHSRQTLADRNPPPAIFSSTVSSSSMLSYAAWWEAGWWRGRRKASYPPVNRKWLPLIDDSRLTGQSSIRAQETLTRRVLREGGNFPFTFVNVSSWLFRENLIIEDLTFSENAFETRNFFLSLIVGIIKEASIDEFREDATIVSLEG